jgi:MFS transporter, DHA2 family, multidrug resistance protein
VKRPPLAAELWWAIRARWRVILAVLPGVAMALAHSTALNVPTADVIDALDTDKYRIHWISGSYLLGSAIGMALTRFAGSRLGFRGAYLVGIALFTVAAAACGLASDVIEMAPARFLQGLGNGLLISVGMVILWRAFPRHRELAMALYGMAVFVPATAGAVIGGLLAAWQSWRWIFLVNLPLGALILLIAMVLLPRERRDKAQLPLDLIGLALLAGTIITLNVVLDLGQYWGWLTSPHFTLWLAAFLVAFVGFIIWGSLARRPLINLRVFGHWNTTFGLLIKVIFSINLYALIAILSLYMVNLRGYQWWQAGLVILPAVVTMIASILLGISVGRAGNRRLRMFAGLSAMALATWQLRVLDLYTSKFWLAGIFAAWGTGAGLVIGPALFTVFEGLALDETTTLAGVFNIFRSIPAYIATVTLVTFWTQATDAHFDTLRQSVQLNRPVVSESYEGLQERFIARGSPRDQSIVQSHALVARWSHANARAFALQDVLRDLTILTAAGVIAVCFVRQGESATKQNVTKLHLNPQTA